MVTVNTKWCHSSFVIPHQHFKQQRVTFFYSLQLCNVVFSFMISWSLAHIWSFTFPTFNRFLKLSLNISFIWRSQSLILVSPKFWITGLFLRMVWLHQIQSKSRWLFTWKLPNQSRVPYISSTTYFLAQKGFLQLAAEGSSTSHECFEKSFSYYSCLFPSLFFNPFRHTNICLRIC